MTRRPPSPLAARTGEPQSWLLCAPPARGPSPALTWPHWLCARDVGWAGLGWAARLPWGVDVVEAVARGRAHGGGGAWRLPPHAREPPCGTSAVAAPQSKAGTAGKLPRLPRPRLWRCMSPARVSAVTGTPSMLPESVTGQAAAAGGSAQSCARADLPQPGGAGAPRVGSRRRAAHASLGGGEGLLGGTEQRTLLLAGRPIQRGIWSCSATGPRGCDDHSNLRTTDPAQIIDTGARCAGPDRGPPP